MILSGNEKKQANNLMNTVVIHPTYFPTIAHFVVMANNDVVFEAHDNYQKQTYRNRMYLYSPNGKQMLSIPIKHTGKDGHQLYKDVQIDYSFNWQKQHWKTLETAYRTSPFFEFYEDEFSPLFQDKPKFLFDLNLKTIEIVADCIGLETALKFTESFEKDLSQYSDFRFLVNAKQEKPFSFKEYIQVFSNKHGYISNLSILDLLFNEGTNSLNYLQQHTL